MASKWTGKSRGNALGYSIFLFLIKYGGLKPAYLLLYFVGCYYLLFAPKVTKALYYYHRKRRHQKPLIAAYAVYFNIISFGKTLIDRFVILANDKHHFTFEFEGENYLRELEAEKKGAILLTAHIGNWEIAGAYLRRLEGSVINVLMHRAEKAAIQKMKDNLPIGQQLNVIAISSDLSHVIEIKNALARGEIVCLQGDRTMEGARSIDLPFIGATAAFPEGPFILASRFKVPVTIVFAMKDSETHYKFSATPPTVMKRGQERALAEYYVENLEKKLKDYPYQWFNFFSFWSDDI